MLVDCWVVKKAFWNKYIDLVCVPRGSGDKTTQ